MYPEGQKGFIIIFSNGALLSVHIIPTSVYSEGQKGAAKRAESPEVRLVLHWEQNLKKM